MYSELSQKRGGRGNRRIKQDAKEGLGGLGGAGCGSKSADGGAGTNGDTKNNTSGRNSDKPRKPKSRSYRELQRKIRNKREKIANRQTNWERHASKKIADGVGTVAMEDLNLNNMAAKGKGRGSSAKTGLNREMAYSRPGTFQRLIRGACANAGVTVIMVDPKGTSTTCHRCGHNDKESRISQGRFRCTNDKCYNDINADVNAAHNIASKAEAVAAGRPGRSSEGARPQSGIAFGRFPYKAREPSAGGGGGLQERQQKAWVLYTHVYNSLKSSQMMAHFSRNNGNLTASGVSQARISSLAVWPEPLRRLSRPIWRTPFGVNLRQPRDQ